MNSLFLFIESHTNIILKPAYNDFIFVCRHRPVGQAEKKGKEAQKITEKTAQYTGQDSINAREQNFAQQEQTERR